MMERGTMQSLVFVLYGVMIVAGVVLNVLFFVMVVWSLERKRSVTRMLMANLALGDLLLLLLSFFSPAATMYQGWPFGELLCKSTPSVSSLSTFVSSFSATAIAVHRYMSITDPRKPKPQTRWCAALVVAIWLASALLSTPIYVNMRLKRTTLNVSVSRCVESWNDRDYGHTFTIACLVLQFVLPTMVITFCYARVGRVLQARLRFHKARAYHRNQDRVLATIRRQRRTTRSLTCMVAVYVVSWLPLNVFNVVVIFWFEKVAMWQSVTLVYLMTHVLATSSAINNPIIYALLNDEFRKQAILNFRRCCGMQVSLSPPHSTTWPATELTGKHHREIRNTDTANSEASPFRTARCEL